MKCKQARSQSSLMAGNDLDSSAVTELQRHLAICPECRDFNGRMTTSMGVLQEVGGEFTYTGQGSAADESLWPRIADAVVTKQPHQNRNRWFNGSVATLAIAATLLAAMSIGQTLNPPESPEQVPQASGFFQGANFHYGPRIEQSRSNQADELDTKSVKAADHQQDSPDQLAPNRR